LRYNQKLSHEVRFVPEIFIYSNIQLGQEGFENEWFGIGRRSTDLPDGDKEIIGTNLFI
jgi:hypothetical protein